MKFRGEYAFLSNFYPSSIMTRTGLWPTAEHLFQACKTSDKDAWERIRVLKSPGKAKKAGRSVRLRPDWERRKYEIMRSVVEIKFKNPELRQRLLATGDIELVEDNQWHDNIWGRCTCPGCKDKKYHNALGKILMSVRSKLKGD